MAYKLAVDRRNAPRARRGRGGAALAWAPALTWAGLLATRGRWWTTDQGLPGVPASGSVNGGPANGGPASGRASAGEWPDVAVVVPAHNEAELVARALTSLLGQDYSGDARIFLVDDNSTDATGEIAREVAVSSAPAGSRRLQVVTGAPRPAGWAGKPWAMHQGFERALQDSPDWCPRYVLFTDADIVHGPSSLRRLVGAAMSNDLGTVSLMAKLSCESAWEKLVVPAFVYFFAQLYPFRWVNDPGRVTAAAAGGCLLVDVAALVGAGGVRSIKGRTIDDVAMARVIKSTGASTWLGLAGGPGAPEVDSVRYYPRLADLWDMVARNAYTQLRHNPLALAGTLAALATTYVAPPALVAWGAVRRRPSTLAAGALAWSAMTATYLPMTAYYGRPAREAWVLPFTAGTYGAMTAGSAVRHYRNRGLELGGRRPGAVAAPHGPGA